MGSRKKQEAGWRYYYTVVLIPARKADAVLAIRMADKLVWEGDQGDGAIQINAPDAFGGPDREGGFSGRIAVGLGGAAQAANAYLQTLFGTLTTAYRGVVSLVFERPYFNANSARLPSIEIKQLNISDIHKGWLPDKCVVDAEGRVTQAAVYIAMDLSGSMTAEMVETQGLALANFVRSMKGATNSLHVVAYAGTIRGSIERLDCDDSDYDDVADWIEGFTSQAAGTNWANAMSEAAAFFAADDALDRTIGTGLLLPTGGLFGGGSVSQTKRRIVILTSDGEPLAGSAEDAAATLAAIGGVEAYGFNIILTDTTEMEKVDNTPKDGVPVVSGSDPGDLGIALGTAFRTWVDLNPAHIQRCLLIDPMRGGTASEAEIGDSFATAADEYLAEGLGLSVIFSGAEGNARDRAEIDRHCDAVTYRSRSTGKWEHKRVRDDFDIEDLPVLDASVVKDWSKLRRPKARELPNKITLIYTDRTNGKEASITRSNPVAVRAAGRTIKGDDARYPFVNKPALADRFCVRDLSAGNTPLLAGDLPLAYLPAGIELSSAVRLQSDDPLIGDVVVRITEIRHGGGTDASAWLKVVEHRFELGAPISLPEVVSPDPVDDRPKVATIRMVEEAPYYVLVLQEGQDAVDAQLSGNADLGRLIAAAVAPNARHLEAVIGVDAGGGWVEDGQISFSASTVTTEDLSGEGDAFEVRVEATSGLTSVVAGQLALIGTEIIRVDAMVEDAGEVILTMGRGCLDTVPVSHASGATVLFFGPGQVADSDYLDGEAVDVKLLTRTGTSLLSLAKAPVDSLTFDSRAIRPYPPGRFKLNGSYVQDQFVGDALLTWAHRDRTLQTTPVAEDHDDADIGPEAGTTYRLRVEALNGAGIVLATVTDTDIGSGTSHDWDETTALPDGTVRLRFSVASVRDGYESWQRPEITALVLLPPGDLFAEVL